MPYIVHDVAVFVVYAPEQQTILDALARVPAEYRHQVVGPAGGTNGFYSVAVLPSGGSPNVFDHAGAFDAIRAALQPVDDDLEAIRVSFGGEQERTELLFTTDDLVRIIDATPIDEPASEFFAPKDVYPGAWSRVDRTCR